MREGTSGIQHPQPAPAPGPKGSAGSSIQTLELREITKRFPGVLANDRVSFDVRSGEVHALLGENGAGKSTLMKILYGLYQPDEGEIYINNRKVTINSPLDAIRQGIGMIHQHFMLVPELTVAENVALGLRSARRGRLDLESVARRIDDLAATYGLKVNPHTPVWQLSVGEQQRVEIIKALYRGADLLVLDEPTAVLTPQEVEDLFRTLRQMRAEGHALIFISHKLHEVLALSDRITVLRNGRRVGTHPTEAMTRPILARMMVGREVLNRSTQEYRAGTVHHEPPLLRLEAVSAYGDGGLLALKDVSLDVHGGEILGIAGVSGNGQRDLAEVMAGMRAVSAGRILLGNDDVTHGSPEQRIRVGVSYIPEERMRDGAIMDFTIEENLILRDHTRPPYARGIFLNRRGIAETCRRLIERFQVKTPTPHTPIKNLSGGNIQKVIMARELSRQPRVLIASQPTRGVDIGATEYIHQLLLDMRAQGAAIVLISEDLDEVLTLCDRIAVMYEGEVMAVLPRAEASPERLGLLMAGVR